MTTDLAEPLVVGVEAAWPKPCHAYGQEVLAATDKARTTMPRIPAALLAVG